ncbi:MAG: phenylacetate--CoA ligase [Proteobacteria bacterium]|nr:phenylacetate--CoA ligase [Pseudomonadota bacterium]
MNLDPKRKFWNPERETMSRDQLRDHQFKELRNQVKYNYENGLFYKNKFDQAGIQPGDIKTWDDFYRIPTMTKDDQRAAQEESLERFGHPYGMLACAPEDKFARISATSGTSGQPTLYTLTRHDVNVNRQLHARKLWLSGAPPGLRILHAMALSMFTGGVPVIDAMMEYGLCVIPVGAEGGVARVLQFVDLCKPHLLTCTPSFAEYIIEKCPEILGKPANELGLLGIGGGGEPGLGIKSVKNRIAKGFGVRSPGDSIGGTHNFHGYTCRVDHGKGMHLISEDYCILELLDPVTKESMELKDGVVGEMCYTYIDWEGTPLMRYCLNDILEITTSPCECGDPRLRFKIIGRADDMLIVKGVNVYPAAFKNSISKFVPRVSGDFRILLDGPPPSVKPPLKMQIELAQDLKSDEIEQLGQQIRADMHADLRVTPAIEFVPPDSFEKATHKGKVFVKLYEEKPADEDIAEIHPLKQK